MEENHGIPPKMIEKLIKSTEEIQGWLTQQEGQLLYKLVGESPGRLIVEIGAWKGRSTAWLLVACQTFGKVLFTVDHFRGSSEHHQMYGPDIDTFSEFTENMNRIIKEFHIRDDKLNVLRMDSVEASNQFPDQFISMIFIDGSHEYELVRQDLDTWYPKIVNGGIVAMHDIQSVGPKQAIRDYTEKYKYIKKLNTIGSIGWWYK